MKHCFSISIFLFLFATLQAQTVKQIPFVFPSNIQGVFTFGNQLGYLSYFEKGNNNQDLYVLDVYNQELESVGKSFFAVEGGSKYLTMASNSSKIAVLFYNDATETLTSIECDIVGNVSNVLSKTFSQDMRYTNRPREIQLDAWGNYHFSSRYSTYEMVKKKKEFFESGFEAYMLDANFNEVVKHIVHNKKEHHHSFIDRVIPLEAGSAVFVTKVHRGMKEYNATLIFYDLEGEISGEYTFGNEEFDAYPTTFKSDGENFHIVGYEYQGKWFAKNRSTGMFLLTLDLSGEVVAKQSIDWKSLDDKLLERSTDGMLFSSKSRLFFHEIFPMESGIRVIAEAYNTNSGVSTAEFLLNTESSSSSRGFTLMDFFVLDFAPNGDLENTTILSKQKRDVQVSNFTSNKRTEEMALEMKEFGIFSYRYCNGEKIGFFNVENGEAVAQELEISSGSIIDSKVLRIEIPEEEENIYTQQFIANSKFLSSLQNLENKIQTLEKGMQEANARFSRAITGIDQSFNRYNSDFGIVTVNNAFIISYVVDKNNYSLYLQK